MIYPYETCVSLAFLPYKTPRKQGKRKAKFHFLLYHAKVLLFLLKYHWFLCKLHNKKDPDLQKSRPKRQTSARSRSLSYTVWFDSILLLCLDTQCTISSCIATGFFPVKRLPEADRILQKIIPCIHRIKPFPRIRVLPQNRIYGFALWHSVFDLDSFIIITIKVLCNSKFKLIQYKHIIIRNYYFLSVLPKPPFRSLSTQSSSVIPYSIKIPCAKASPCLICTALLPSFVILIKICPSLSEK